MAKSSATLALVWLAFCAGCQREVPPRFLALEHFGQSGAQGVLLNEELKLYFSSDLDPTSVHAGTVRLLDQEGEEVPIELFVDRLRGLTVRPLLPKTAGLEDGSLRPAASYTLQLVGFPNPDALRGRDGEPLQRTRSFRFETVALGNQMRAFVDPVSGTPRPLSVESLVIGTAEPLVLQSFEPIDPRSLKDTDFELLSLTPQSTREGFESAPEEGSTAEAKPSSPSAEERLERIRLRPSLLTNSNQGARLALYPLAADRAARRLLEPGEYLAIATQWPTSLRDFDGQPFVAAFGSNAADGARLSVEVDTKTSGNPRNLGLIAEDFIDTAKCSLATPSDCDGTLLWDGSGGLSPRLPKAAGSGRDGDRRFEKDHVLEADLECTRLELASTARVRLEAGGVLVIAAQGSMNIDGSLLRSIQAADLALLEDEEPEAWWRRLSSADPDRLVPGWSGASDESLSGVIAAAREAGLPWTFLVSGGDLTVRGSLRFDGPLFLVAGGFVRLPGEVLASEVWISTPRSGRPTLAAARDFKVWIDPPEWNPLVVGLRWSVISKTYIPKAGEFHSWGPVEHLVQLGAGRYRASFEGERRRADGALIKVGPVEDALLLDDCPALSFRVDLELDPAPEPGTQRFAPPRLDALHLYYFRR